MREITGWKSSRNSNSRWSSVSYSGQNPRLNEDDRKIFKIGHDVGAAENKSSSFGPLGKFIDVVDARIDKPLNERSIVVHIGVVVLSLGMLGAVFTALNGLYAASNHPASFAVGQTSFSASEVKEWYAIMSNAGTLDTYVYTQLFDFLFMIALALLGLVLASLLRRFNQPWKRGMTLARFGGLTIFSVLASTR